MAVFKINFILLVFNVVIFISKGNCEVNESNESNELDEYFLQSKIGWRSVCNKSEYDVEFNELNDNSHNEIKICLTDAIMSSLGERFKNDNEPPLSLDSDFEIVCDIIPLTISCVHNFTNKYSFCFNETMNEGFNIGYDWLNKISDFICMNKGKRLKVLYDQAKCIKENSQLNECIEQELNLIYSQINSTTSSEEKDDSAITIKDCNYMKKIEECFVEHLDNCPGTEPSFSPSNTVNELFGILRNITNCDTIERENIKLNYLKR